MFKGLQRIAATAAILSVPGLTGACFAQEEKPVPLHAEISPAPVKNIQQSKKCQPKQCEWELRKYPIIRWKQHPVTTIQGATVQLSTTFNDKRDMFGRGVLRYTVTASQIPPASGTFIVQLLDANGFKLTEFEIKRDRFHPVPGTALLEAADEHPCTMKEYKQAADYVVM
ncbi:MAG: hypothetical protein K2Y22_03865 [Candidatus Obscuribacterales bacterium]|nr:hypothetical protein [Candidatus Obscuribacterales bacterium]